MGVLGQVTRGGQDVGRILQLDDAGLLQQQQRTTAVGRIVGQHDGGAVLQIVQALDLARVQAEGLDVHGGFGHGHDVGLVFLVEGIQVRAMQEEVGVNRLVDRGLDGLHVVVEDANPKLHAFGLQLGFDEVQQLGVRNRGGGHAEGFGLDAGNGQGKHGNCGQAAGKFLDHRVPVGRLEIWTGPILASLCGFVQVSSILMTVCYVTFRI